MSEAIAWELPGSRQPDGGGDGGDGNLEHGMAIAQLSGVELPAHTEVSSKRDDKVRPFSAQN